LDDNNQDTFLSINGSEFISAGKAVVTLPFVLGIDILDNATLDLAHGLAVIPKLSFEGPLERGEVGGIFAVSKQTAAVKDLQELLDRYAELLGPHLVDGSAMEPVALRLKDPDKLINF
jgi:hypothetical protein